MNKFNSNKKGFVLLARRSLDVGGSSPKGFTLLETIIYIALTAFLLTSALITSYQIIDSSSFLNKKAISQGEADFLFKKIEWAMNSASSIVTPAAGGSGSSAKIIRGPDTIEFSSVSQNINMTVNAGSPVILNSQVVIVNNLSFEHIHVSGKPDGLKTNITLNNNVFTSTIFLKY